MFNLYYLIAAIILGALPVPIFILIRRRTDYWDGFLLYLHAEHILIGRLIGLYPKWYDSSDSGFVISFETNYVILIFTIVLNCAILALFFYIVLLLLGRLLA